MFTDADAQRMLQVMDERIERRLREAHQFHWGVVSAVNNTTSLASVYLYGESTNASPGFRFPHYRVPAVGDTVLVRIAPGDRVIEDIFEVPPKADVVMHTAALIVNDPSDDYTAVSFRLNNVATGLIDVGTGATENFRMVGFDGAGANPEVMVEHDPLNRNQYFKGFGRLRFVGLSSQIQVANGATTTSATDVNNLSAEMTGLPLGTKAVTGHVICANSTANNGYVYASNYEANAAFNGIAYAGNANLNSASAFVVSTGGTNNRQMRYTVRAGTGTLTYYVRVTGAFVDDNV